MLCHGHPSGAAFDPGRDETIRRGVVLSGDAPGDGIFATVGWRAEGLVAARMAAAMPERVARLVLCCVPAPIDVDPGFDPSHIAAKTLLLFGQFDPEAPPQHARWWKDHIPRARIEMVPRAGSDIIEALWKRTLSHVAPRVTRRP